MKRRINSLKIIFFIFITKFVSYIIKKINKYLVFIKVNIIEKLS